MYLTAMGACGAGYANSFGGGAQKLRENVSATCRRCDAARYGRAAGAAGGVGLLCLPMGARSVARRIGRAVAIARAAHPSKKVISVKRD